MQIDPNLKHRLTERGIWLRLLFMVLFAVIYNLAELALLVIALFQFGSKLATGRLNRQLLAFARNLNIFVYQIWGFLSFTSEELPFPFSEWPDAKQTLNRYNGTDAETTTSEQTERASVSLSKEP